MSMERALLGWREARPAVVFWLLTIFVFLRVLEITTWYPQSNRSGSVGVYLGVLVAIFLVTSSLILFLAGAYARIYTSPLTKARLIELYLMTNLLMMPGSICFLLGLPWVWPPMTVNRFLIATYNIVGHLPSLILFSMFVHREANACPPKPQQVWA